MIIIVWGSLYTNIQIGNNNLIANKQPHVKFVYVQHSRLISSALE